MRYLKCLIIVLGVLSCTITHAQQEGRSAPALERRILNSFADGDYEAALGLIEPYLADHPNDVVMLYNAACAYCLLNQPERGATYLLRSVQSGFRDLDQIVNDADLESIREHPKYKVVVERLQSRAARRANDALNRWRSTYGTENYRYERDEERRIAYATALDRTSHDEMRQMLQEEADHLKATLFDVEMRSYVLIAVPTPSDGDRIFDADNIGGIYEHSRRRLIARDIGGALRHEFVHALHYAHMDRLRQKHPLWIQEGIASLFEDYTLNGDGTIKFHPNERHNVVRGLAKAGQLRSWSTLFRFNDDEFMDHASRHYPQVRSIFEFIADQDKLACWYESLIEHYEDDRTGALAFRACFNLPLDDIERAWRRWVLERPPVDLSIQYGDAALGIESRPRGSNDGVLITRVLPGSAAAVSGLEVGDVVVAVDDRPTRSLTELQTIIASRSIGESVSIRARRNQEYFITVVTLRPLRRIMW